MKKPIGLVLLTLSLFGCSDSLGDDTVTRDASEHFTSERLEMLEQAMLDSSLKQDCKTLGNCKKDIAKFEGLPFVIEPTTCIEPRPKNTALYPLRYYPVYIEYSEETLQTFQLYCGLNSGFPKVINNKIYVASVKGLDHAKTFVSYIKSNSNLDAGWQVNPEIWLMYPNDVNPIVKYHPLVKH
jgi:hypothetical protein